MINIQEEINSTLEANKPKGIIALNMSKTNNTT